MTPDLELLLACASPAGMTRIDPPRDWGILLTLADRHRLTPLLYTAMAKACPEAIPMGLEAAFRGNLKNSLLLTRDLIVIADILRREGIPALPFKGPTLALQAYGDTALRAFSDLDILVKREDVWRVRDILIREGFRPERALKFSHQAAYLRAYDELVMVGPGGRPLVEVHWAFAPPHFSFDLEFEACWERRVRIELAGRSIPVLHPDDLLLVLCVHAAKHCWSRLGLICDIAWFLSKQPVNRSELLARARSKGVLRMVLVTWLLAQRFFGVAVDPRFTASAAADSAAVVLADRTATTLMGPGHDEESILDNLAVHLRMRENLNDRRRYLAQLATRTGVEDWEFMNLPGFLDFLYPLLRYPRLALKYRPGSNRRRPSTIR